MIKYLFPFLIPLSLSLIFTPVIKYFAIKFGHVAYPNKDRWHKSPTALLGGIGIFAAFIVTVVYFFHDSIISNRVICGFTIGITIVFLTGLLDDFIHIKPHTKLIGQVIAACVLLASGISFNFLPTSILNMFLTIIWIVGITNAFNLLDNMDGLCAGLTVIAAFMFSIYFISSSSPILAILSFAIAGAALGFLKYNFNPAKIFMGDSGSLFLGFSIATLAVIGTRSQVSNLAATLAVPVLILSLPIFDTAFVALRRKASGRPISQGGKDHTSHQLVLLGISERRTVLLLYLISMIFGSVALLFEKFGIATILMLSFLALIVFLFFGVFLTDYDTNNNRRKSKSSNINQSDKTILRTIFLHKRRFLEVLMDLTLVCIAYYSAYLLRFEGAISDANYNLMLNSIPLIIIFRTFCFFYFGLYRGIWRYVGISDVVAIFKAVSLGSILTIITLTLFYRFQEYSRVVFVIDWLIALFLIAGIRVLIRVLHDQIALAREGGKRVLIVGAGDAGEMLLREIKNNRHLNYKPIGFIDDDIEKMGREIHGLPVLGTQNDLSKFIVKDRVDEVIIAIISAESKNLQTTIDICKEYNIPCKEMSKII